MTEDKGGAGSPLAFDGPRAAAEVEHVVEFLRRELEGAPAVVAVSGGLDSDVVARITVRAVGGPRTKLFVVLQDDMDPRHLSNAADLAADLRLPLAKVDMRGWPVRLVETLAAADPDEGFDPSSLLDPSRAKCSLRTPILSTYQDRGYAVIGTSNRTEFESGFFLPFGDGLGHVQPIVHLYKSQVRAIASVLGVRAAVLDQPASSGFWIGAEDLLDLAYWLFAGGPIRRDLTYSQADLDLVSSIRAELTTERVDLALWGICRGAGDAEIAHVSEISALVIARFRTLVTAAQASKHRPMCRRLDPCS